MVNFKIPKFRSEKHLRFIRSLPCMVCLSFGSEAAHIRIFTDGGTSLKPSDHYTVPLCHRDHQRQHNVGELTFWGGEETVRKLIDFAVSLVNSDFDTAKQQIILKTWRK